MTKEEELKNVCSKAFELAKYAFRDKIDKTGKPYVDHLFRVSKGCYVGEVCIPVYESIIVESAAVLHDILEDCEEWNEKSLSYIFPKEVLNLVIILTKVKNENYLESYIQRISENKLASRIKLSELRDNMDLTRLIEITDKDIERVKKYHKAYKILEKCI